MKSRREACFVGYLFKALDQQVTRDSLGVGIGHEQIAGVRIVEMMQCFSAPTFFVGAVLEQTFEIYDRPGLAVVHFDLDD